MTVEELLARCDLVRASEKKLTECKLHYYEKNGFRYLISDERLEAKYMGIGVGRLPLNTRLMYFDLLKIKVNEE